MKDLFLREDGKCPSLQLQDVTRVFGNVIRRCSDGSENIHVPQAIADVINAFHNTEDKTKFFMSYNWEYSIAFFREIGEYKRLRTEVLLIFWTSIFLMLEIPMIEVTFQNNDSCLIVFPRSAHDSAAFSGMEGSSDLFISSLEILPKIFSGKSVFVENQGKRFRLSFDSQVKKINFELTQIDF